MANRECGPSGLFDEAIAARMRDYLPRMLDAAQQSAWLGDLKAAVARVGPKSPHHAVVYLTGACRFLADTGADASKPLSAVLTPEAIEAWTAGALQEGRAPGSVNNARVRLEQLRRVMNGLGRRPTPKKKTPKRPAIDDDGLARALSACTSDRVALGALVAVAGARQRGEGLTGLTFVASGPTVSVTTAAGIAIGLLSEFDRAAAGLQGVALPADAWETAADLLERAGLSADPHRYLASFDLRAFDGRRPFVRAARAVQAGGATRSTFQTIVRAALSTPAGPFDAAGLRGAPIAGARAPVTVPGSPLERGAQVGAAMAARPSKAEARRRAAQERQRRQQMPDLPAEVAAVIDRYRPADVADAVWVAVKALHREVIRRAGITSAASATKARSVLAGFLVWRHDQGLTLTVEAVCSIKAIDDYFMRGMEDFTLKSRNDYRARLNTLARAANPSADAPPRVGVGYQKLRPGYTPAEEATLRRVVLRQSRPTVRRQACAIVGLCGGAGLDATALRHVRARHVHDLGDDGIAVDVQGDTPRRVMVRRAYEPVVRAALEGREPEDLLVGTNPDRRNVTTGVVQQGEFFDDTPRIEARRLRTTWLTWLVHQPVSLRTILDAAGLRTARSLVEILEMLPAEDPEHVDPILRGEV